jgi:hypothetical protein
LGESVQAHTVEETSAEVALCSMRHRQIAHTYECCGAPEARSCYAPLQRWRVSSHAQQGVASSRGLKLRSIINDAPKGPAGACVVTEETPSHFAKTAKASPMFVSPRRVVCASLAA